MQSMMGIITNTKSEELLKEITQYRCMSAVPFGSRYRLIDFVLSNMVNSGIRNVAVITSHKYRALMDHLGAGKEWGLDRKTEGLVILPSASPSIFRKQLRFDLKDFYANYDYLEKSKQKYVVVAGNNMICSVNYKDALNFHREKNAHITMFYKEEKGNTSNLTGFIFPDVEEDGRVSSIHKTEHRIGNNNISMEMIILERTILMEIIKVALSSGNWDLADIVIDNLDDLRVYGYAFPGYLAKINSVESYFKHNMDLLDPDKYNELFFGAGPIYTKTKDGPPTKYTGSSNACNTLVATGCSILGDVQNSILFRGVYVGKGAQIKNSIIMQKCAIEENVVLENVILDKEVTVRKGMVLKGKKGQPIIIGKKNMI